MDESEGSDFELAEGEEEDVAEESEHESLPDEIRQDFDISEPRSHSYLFNEDTVEVINIDFLPDDKSHTLRYIRIEQVIVPGERLPLSPRCPFSMQNLQKIIESKQLVILLSNTRAAEYDPHHNAHVMQLPCIAVVAKITKHQIENGPHAFGMKRVSAELCAIHRCKVFSMDFANRKCGFTILPEYLRPSVMSLTLPNYALSWSPAKKAALCSSLINYPMCAIYDLAEKHCEILIKHLSPWFGEKSLRNILSMGKVPFGFWVAANFMLNTDQKYELLSEDSTDVRLAQLAEHVRKVNRVACTNCGIILFKTADIIRMSCDGIGGNYVNPGGVVHNLVTVSQVDNFQYRGPSSTEFCWFPGYRWKIIMCARCDDHLGWEYSSDHLKPRRFFGMTFGSLKPIPDLTEED